MANSESNKTGKYDVPTIMFVATTPFAVNAFLVNHIAALSIKSKVILCTNLETYKLTPSLFNSAQVHHIAFSRKISIVSDLKSLLKLTMLVHQVRPAVIHSITPKAGLLAMLAGFIMRIPNRWHTFTGQVWVTKRGFNRSALKLFDRLIVLLSSKIFADSFSQCRLLSDEGIVEKDQIGILGSGSIAGVDIKRFCSDTLKRQQLRQKMVVGVNVCVFLYVGRLVKDKGIFDLTKAFLELSLSVCDVELWVVGPDEEGLLELLKKSAEGCNAPIRWLGATPAPEQFMLAADVLLLPSYREGFGSVIIEGAAAGIPAIAYRIDGVIDAIVDGSSGILVEPGETSAFVYAMSQLALNRELRMRLGNQARERVLREFSSEQVTSAWLKFYYNHLSLQNEATH